MCPAVKYNLIADFRKLQITSEKTTKVTEISPRDTPFTFTSTTYPHFEPIKITEIQKLSTKWKETYKIKLNKEIEYNPCDSIGLMVPNPDWMVEELFRISSLENTYCRIERSGLNNFIFEGSVRDFIKYRMDLKTLPKKKQLMDLLRTSKKKECIEYLVSPEGTRDYLNMGVRMNTLLEIIQKFECKPTFEDLVNNCEIIKPRYYSLIQREGNSEILLGVVSKNIDGEIIYGHVSEFIRRCPSVDLEYCFRKNKLFESLKTRNLLCFCTGTGIAPYIAFYRKYLRDGVLDNLKLVYGYRNDEDNLIKYYDQPTEEIKFAQTSKKEYVQDFVNKENIQDGYCVFICGNMRMQKSVFDKIKQEFPQLIADKRIYFDNWS